MKKLISEISHIEDISIQKFIDLIRRLVNQDESLELSQKIDGSANLALGIDEEGKLYLDRAIKGQSDRKTSPDDWSKKPMYNAIRAAAAAILQNKEKFEEVMKPGDWTDFEVLFEEVPNVIEYGKDLIIFHNEKYSYLVDKIKLISGKIDLYFYDLDDRQIRKSTRTITFELHGKEIVDTKKYKLSIEGDLDRLEEFLSNKNETFSKLTNFEVLSQKTSGKNKEAIKTEKDRLEVIVKQLKINIKDRIIDDVLNKLPSLDIAAEPVFDEEGYNIDGTWPEGIVIKDLNSGDLVKVVSVFPVINKFLWKYRELANKGLKEEETWVVGVLQDFKNKVADRVFRTKALKTPSAISYISRNYLRMYVNQALLKLLSDNKFDFNNIDIAVKRFIDEAETALVALKNLKEEFEKNKSKELNIEKGMFKRSIKYGEIHIRKTYETFIDVESELNNLITSAKTITAKTNKGKAVQLLRIFLGQNNLNKLAEVNITEIAKELDQEDFQKLNEETKKLSIGVVLGRMQPPSLMHYSIIKEALSDNNAVFVFLAGLRFDDKNFLSFSIRKKILRKINGKVIVYPAKTGFIPGLIEEYIKLNKVDEINVYCGTDRVEGFRRQFDQHWNHSDITVNVNEVNRENEVSATKIREAIRKDKFEQFLQMAFTGTQDMKVKKKIFSLYRKYMEKNNGR